VADVQDRVTPWTSGSINSDELLSAAATQTNPIAEFTNEILTHVDDNYRLRPMPAITPDLARKRADSLAGLDDITTLQKFVELRYYHAQHLLTDDEAVAVADRLVGSPRGRQVLLGDEPQRRTVLSDLDPS
jgi:hypothetical protein